MSSFDIHEKLNKIKEINIFFIFFSFFIYLTIFIFFPHQVNKTFEPVNLFINQYLLGNIFPTSEKLSFKIKAVWCFSFIINLSFFIFIFLYFYFLKKKDVILLYNSFYNIKTEPYEDKQFYFNRILLFLFLIFICLFVSFYPYAYGNPTYYSSGYKMVRYEFFYQNLYPSFLLFLTMMLLVFYNIFYLILNFYIVFSGAIYDAN